MTVQDQKQLGKTLWEIADGLRGAMNADDFRDYMLSFLFLRYLSDNYEEAVKKELGRDYPQLEEANKHRALGIWYKANEMDVPEFEKQMRRKVHYVIKPQYLWSNISEWLVLRMESCYKHLKKALDTLKMSHLKVLSKAYFRK